MIKETLAQAVEGRNLKHADMKATMQEIMGGEATPAQVAGLLVALRMKGETVDELTAAAEVMRQVATHVDLPVELRDELVDTCGTGGDGKRLFNVSTAVAFVVAAAGGRVAKHGNRSVSSRCGSADLLEAAGVKIDLGPEGVRRCIEEVGVGFMFAPTYHAAMKHAIGPRREMGVRTLFNLIGPLTNPAGAPNQLMGVYASNWLEPLAEVLNRLGTQHAILVHSDDGLDEISVAAATQVTELKEGLQRSYTVSPNGLGLAHDSLEPLQVNDVQESLKLVREALSGTEGPARDIVVLNAAAALLACNRAEDLEAGVKLAVEAVEQGGALDKLEALATLSQTLQ